MDKLVCEYCGEPLGPNPVRRGEHVYCCDACAYEAERPADCAGRTDTVLSAAAPEPYTPPDADS
jgi:hypothetical protein